MSFPRAVFLYCLETATVISVRRFTDGHRAQWRRNDLFGSLLLLGRAICCLGMGGARPASFFVRASRRWRCPRRRGAARRCMCLEVPRLERARERSGVVVRRRFVPKPADPLADADDGSDQLSSECIRITPVRGHFTSRLGSCGDRLVRVCVMGYIPPVHVLWKLDAAPFGDRASFAEYVNRQRRIRLGAIWVAGHHHVRRVVICRCCYFTTK